MHRIKLTNINQITSCEVLITADLLDNLGEILQTKLQNESIRPKFACISDSNVAPLYMDRLQATLQNSGFTSWPIIIPAGELNKNYDNLRYILNQLTERHFKRHDIIISLGGGMISDIAGFAAAIFLRGIRFINIATSLLAQIDASIGGKTGINTEFGKNLIGSFYSPIMVISDISLLQTLPEREFRSGYAEMVKYGLINNAKFFNFCEKNINDILAKTDLLEIAVKHCVEAKAKLVSGDYLEQNERALLNLGHSFGHALEAASSYSLLHGEAISVGIVLAFAFSAFLKLGPKEALQRVAANLSRAGLPTDLNQLPLPSAIKPQQLLAFMQQDKKNTNEAMTLILAKNIGASFVAKGIAPDLLQQFLEKQLDKKGKLVIL